MTTKYLYIQAGRKLDNKSVFVVVMVSEHTKQGKRDLDFLNAFSDQKGYFFARFSSDIADFLGKCENQIVSQYGLDAFDIKKCDARDLVRSIKDSEPLPIDYTQERNRRLLLESIDSAYRLDRILRA